MPNELKNEQDAPPNVETVFVLGAGASYDFGFPTGEELIGEILGLSEDIQAVIKHVLNKQSINSLNNLRYKNVIDFMQNFIIERLNGSGEKYYHANMKNLSSALPLAKSIDNYLNDQGDKELQNFGKIIIAAALLRAECEGLRQHSENPRSNFVKLANFDKDNNLVPPDFLALRATWLPTFFRELRTDNGKESGGLEAFKNRLKKIAIVTFNYERSFEYFMEQAFLAYQPDLSDDDRNELMKILLKQIVHPYGSLGTLDELPFATELKAVQDWGVFTNRLAIFTESEALNTELNIQREKARAWVAEAKNIVFLGFGFHEQNMEYLGFKKNHNVGIRKTYTTALGWSEHRQKGLHKRLTRRNQNLTLGNSQPNQDCFLVPDTCKRLLEEFADQIFPKS